MYKIIPLMIVVLLSFSCSNSQKQFSEDALSKKLTAADQTEITFANIIKEQRGKVTLIEIWASWCSDCVKAMPKVKAMQEANPEVNYVFISMDKTFDKWINGIEKHQLTGSHYWATDGMKGAFGKAVDVDWIPRYIVLDKEGNVIIYRAIETDFDKINATLKELK